MRALAAAIMALALGLAGCGGEPKADAEFGAKVRAYLLEHPEVLQEAFERLQAKQDAQAQASATQAIQKNRQALERDPRDFVANPNGAVTVVEFFDYNCSYCKLIAPQVLEVIRSDPQVRFVMKDLTIFGEGSELAAAGAQLGKPSGKYLSLHQQMMAEKALDEAAVSRILIANGISPDAARAQRDAPAQQRYLADVQKLAGELGIQGTPAFVVGDTMIPGANPEALKAAIAAAKAKAKA